MKTWWREVLPFRLALLLAMKLLVAFSARFLGENNPDWLLAKYILIDSLWRLLSPPVVFSLLIDAISLSSFDFSSKIARFDSLSVYITACLVSSCYYRRVAERFDRVMLLCLKAYFLIKTVFSSSICLLFINKTLLLCYSSRSRSSIFALS